MINVCVLHNNWYDSNMLSVLAPLVWQYFSLETKTISSQASLKCLVNTYWLCVMENL